MAVNRGTVGHGSSVLSPFQSLSKLYHIAHNTAMHTGITSHDRLGVGRFIRGSVILGIEKHRSLCFLACSCAAVICLTAASSSSICACVGSFPM